MKPTGNHDSANEEIHREVRIQVYKWLKILQSVILIALGIIFLILANHTSTGSSSALSYSFGIILAIYGIINIVSGYILNRSLWGQDILFGILSLSMGMVMFAKEEYLSTVLVILVISVMICYACMLIVYGVDKIIGKGTKKNIGLAVLSFFGASFLAALVVCYFIFKTKDETKTYQFIMMIVGILLIAIGILTLVLFFIKLHYTRKIEREEEIQKEKEKEEAQPDTSHEVKVIDIKELKRRNRQRKKKTEVIVVSNGDEEDK